MPVFWEQEWFRSTCILPGEEVQRREKNGSQILGISLRDNGNCA
jgi:hypothetical protein